MVVPTCGNYYTEKPVEIIIANMINEVKYPLTHHYFWFSSEQPTFTSEEIEGGGFLFKKTTFKQLQAL